VDVAVRVGRLGDSNLVARPLASVRLIVCGAPAYFAEHGTPQIPSDLAHHNCLIYTQGAPRGKWLFREPEGDIAVPVSGNFEASAGDAVRIAAIRGCGLAQLATYVVGADLQAGRLQAVLIEYEPEAIPIHAVYPQRRLLSATVRAFVEFLQARFQPIPYWDETLAEPAEAHQQPFVPVEGL
jgi:DNA-binding transcriptional LysR family regulator